MVRKINTYNIISLNISYYHHKKNISLRYGGKEDLPATSTKKLSLPVINLDL